MVTVKYCTSDRGKFIFLGYDGRSKCTTVVITVSLHMMGKGDLKGEIDIVNNVTVKGQVQKETRKRKGKGKKPKETYEKKNRKKERSMVDKKKQKVKKEKGPQVNTDSMYMRQSE